MRSSHGARHGVPQVLGLARRASVLAAFSTLLILGLLGVLRTVHPHSSAAAHGNDELYAMRRVLARRAAGAGGGAKAAVAPTRTTTRAEPRVLGGDAVRRIVSKLPAELRRRHGNCSVVGNDSSMRRSGYGPLIDGASTVYRMNFAPLKGYASDVGTRTHTECINPEKLRIQLKENPRFLTDDGSEPRVLVVGDVDGSDESGNAGPCVESSPGGLCVRRTDSQRVANLPAVLQELAEELLFTLQGGVGEEDSVPTTGLYCLVLALYECEAVDVFGIGAGTIAKKDLGALEYFQDKNFRGWDARHNVEAERTLLRVLASRVWAAPLTEPLASMYWHNPLKTGTFVNQQLVDRECTSGIHC